MLVFTEEQMRKEEERGFLSGISYEQMMRTAGENAAAGASSPQEVMDVWMNSPGHRQNILNPDFRYLGVGYAYVSDSQYNNYWIQIFSD